MPWETKTVSVLRKEFVLLATQEGANKSEQSRRFNVSRKTGYKWIHRYIEEGYVGLEDRSRRPHQSPGKASGEMEGLVIGVREDHPSWGGRKIKRRLTDLGCRGVPVASTITEILRRNGMLNEEESIQHQAFKQFERSKPNELWQVDFKGHVPCPEGRCHPLTGLDDHSRYSVMLESCLNEQGDTVKGGLTKAFRHYGIPWQILMDNGSPWGAEPLGVYTPVEVWLIRLGIRVIHGRPRHPQTQGKEERFHRTLKVELLGNSVQWDQEECQRRFDEWRMMYNYQRPHESLDLNVPASRYQPSSRSYTERLEDIEYNVHDIVRKVQQNGYIWYQNREYRIPKAFRGERVAIRPRADQDGMMDVYYCQQKIAEINLRTK